MRTFNAREMIERYVSLCTDHTPMGYYYTVDDGSDAMIVYLVSRETADAIENHVCTFEGAAYWAEYHRMMYAAPDLIVIEFANV